MIRYERGSDNRGTGRCDGQQRQHWINAGLTSATLDQRWPDAQLRGNGSGPLPIIVFSGSWQCSLLQGGLKGTLLTPLPFKSCAGDLHHPKLQSCKWIEISYLHSFEWLKYLIYTYWSDRNVLSTLFGVIEMSYLHIFEWLKCLIYTHLSDWNVLSTLIWVTEMSYLHSFEWLKCLIYTHLGGW